MFKNNLYAFVFFTCFWFLLVIASGSLFSGYKFMDDSGHIVLASKLEQGQGAFGVIRNYITNDLQSRFRPIWSAEYAARTVLLKDNFFLHSVYRALETVFICFFLFLFARKLRLSQRSSTLFALLTTAGQQAVITWALAPSEGIGMLFLSLSLLFMAKAVFDEEKKMLNEILFIFFTLLMSLSKESFIFFVPAIYIWRLWLTSNKYNISIFQAIRQTIFYGVLLAALTLADLALLIGISTNFGYAGTDKSLGISSYIKALLFLILFSVSGIISLVGLILIIIKKQFRPQKWIYPTLLVGAIILPQILIYAKSGIAERYFLPAVMGFAVLIIHQLVIIDKDPVHYSVNRKIAMVLSMLSTLVFAMGLLLALSEGTRIFIIKTMYGFRGNVVQEMNPLEMVIARSNANIQVMGAGIALIGLTLVAGCIALIVLKIKNFRFYHAFMIIVLLGVGINTVLTFGLARKFAKEGKTVNHFISSIIEHTKPDDAILVVADTWVHLEASTSGLPCYLKLKAGRNKLFGKPISLDTRNGAPEADSIFYTVYQKTDAATTYPCIAFFPGTERLLLADSTQLNLALYNRNALDNGYVVYSLK